MSSNKIQPLSEQDFAFLRKVLTTAILTMSEKDSKRASRLNDRLASSENVLKTKRISSENWIAGEQSRAEAAAKHGAISKQKDWAEFSQKHKDDEPGPWLISKRICPIDIGDRGSLVSIGVELGVWSVAASRAWEHYNPRYVELIVDRLI